MQPNLRAGKPNKVQHPYTIQDSYKDYVVKYPEGSVYFLTYPEYKDITTMYLNHIADNLVQKSITVRLPFRLGTLAVVKHKPIYKSIKNMVIDWTRSKELSKQVRQFNDHSNGFIYRFHWDRKNCITDNKTAYMFNPTRLNKREVARLVKTKQNDYFERN
jgi:hypothetical protein